MKRGLAGYGWGLIALLAIFTALKNVRYLSGDPADYGPLFADKYLTHYHVVLTHGVCAIVTLAIGPFQFLDALRRARPRFHRVLGHIYLLGVLFGGLAGIRMGVMAFGGPIVQSAFCLFAGLWIVTGALALVSILQRRVAEHRRWMLRNFALTFGAVTLRLYLNLLQLGGAEFETIYGPVVFAAWIPNLIAVELWLARGRLRPLFQGESLGDLPPSASKRA